MIYFVKNEDVSVYLSALGKDTDRDFARDVEKNEGNLSVIYNDSVPVGVLAAEKGRCIWAHIYIFPEYRGYGFGAAAYELFLSSFVTDETEEIMTFYDESDRISSAFVDKRGYTKKFSSDYMVFNGKITPQPSSVRPYNEMDFEEVFGFYSEAFHLMRLSTGCFPESQPAKPTEAQRKYWSETAAERFVFVSEGCISAVAHINGEEISSISVHPEYQGKGIGRRFLLWLMAHILADHHVVELYCVVGNHKAKRLYDSVGFKAQQRISYARKIISKK